MSARLNLCRWLALAVMLVTAWFNYRYMIDFTLVMFASPIEDMSHGWVVPLVSLYVLWKQRAELRAAAGQPCWPGVAWVAFFLAIAWFGGRGGQSRLEQVSLIGLIWSVPYAFWGRRVERLMRFPAAYLIFTIPVSSFIDFFTIHLRILSSSLATGLLNGFGVAVEQAGTALYSRVPGAAFNVDVADPCSGIRSLFAMMALTAAYAFFTQHTRFRKWALFVCSLPIAMLGNMVRIMSICLMAVWFGQDVATGYYHDYSGYIVFVVGVLLMLRLGDLLKNYGGVCERHLPTFLSGCACHGSAEAEAAPQPAKGAYAPVALVCLATVAVFTSHLLMPEPAYEQKSFVASALPEKVGEFAGDVPWFCQNPQCLKVAEEKELLRAGPRPADGFVCPDCGEKMSGTSLGERTDLPKDTVIIRRNYRAADGLVYSVNVVVGGRNRNSIHRAELCLPGQGYVMLKAGRMNLQVAKDVSLDVRKVVTQKAGRSTQCLVYWFLSRERETCSHAQRILLDVWDRSIHNRINRWVMIAVNVSSELESPESKERLAAFLSELYPQIVVGR